MPRRSAASHLAVIPGSPPERLRPPSELRAAERRIFLDIVNAVKPEHFKSSDLPLLCAYTRAIDMERRSAGDPKALGRWASAIKAMCVLSVRLKLSPQARAPNKPRPSGKPQPVQSYPPKGGPPALPGRQQKFDI
jgi:hypothetical protein